MNGRLGPAEQRLELGTPLGERHVAQIAIAEAQQIEKHDRRGNLLREKLDARERRVNTKLERFEIEPAVTRHDQLAVEYALFRELTPEMIDELGEIAVERLGVAALDHDLVAIAENEHPKSVPLRLEDPRSPAGSSSVRLASMGNTGGGTKSSTPAS